MRWLSCAWRMNTYTTKQQAEAMARDLWLVAHSGVYSENHSAMLENAAEIIRLLISEIESHDA